MRRIIAAILTLTAVLCTTHVSAQDDARRKQAAAEAYDRGTAAYLDGSYAEAAQWFETAHRMAPAAPALMQAIRSHQRAENFSRAATLALRLQQDYAGDKSSTDYAASVLGDLSPQYLRVDVTCDQDCKLDVDGKLQESHSFFVDPGSKHKVIATFSTGSKSDEVQGEAGATKPLEFVAPPAPIEPVVTPGTGGTDTGTGGTPVDHKPKPLAPVFTFIGGGLTIALGAGVLVSGLDANAGAPAYKKAAAAYNACAAVKTNNCTALQATAWAKYNAGHPKQIRTNILIAATAAVGVTTAVIAIFLTNWSGKAAASSQGNAGEKASASFGIVPTRDGALGFVEGRF